MVGRRRWWVMAVGSNRRINWISSVSIISLKC
jgi:hypothetical protein